MKMMPQSERRILIYQYCKKSRDVGLKWLTDYLLLLEYFWPKRFNVRYLNHSKGC